MAPISLGPEAPSFVWASGVEDTFVPQTRAGHRALDEYQLMGHYEHWREDLALARDLGVSAIRWGIPWYRVEKLPGEFDWQWTDEVVPFLVQDLGITPIIDLMHYGCPFWLRREFISNDYPRLVAAYSAAFAERYKSLVRYYTPLNEPLVNALMCGKRGLWPPYLRGDAGYIRVMLQLAKGITATVRAIQSIDPSAVMVHVEATGLSRAARAELEALAVEETRRGYLSLDLVTGRVTPEHPLFTWLLRHGASSDDLARMAGEAIPLDVLGMNFYPQWSTQQLYLNRKGRLAYRRTEQEGTGFSSLIEDYWRRYNVPIMVTETSAHGSEEIRSAWLDASIAQIRELRGRGVPVIGYTWFPMMTMIDWRYRFGKRPPDAYRIELGLYRLTNWEGRPPRWEPTSLVARFQHAIRNPLESIGPMNVATAAAAANG